MYEGFLETLNFKPKLQMHDHWIFLNWADVYMDIRSP